MANRFNINPSAKDHDTHREIVALWDGMLARFLLKPSLAMDKLYADLNPGDDLRARLGEMDDVTLKFMSNLATTALAELWWRAHKVSPVVGDGDDGDD